MARQNIDGMLERKVSRLREGEKAKKEELIQIQKELRRYETALESLKGNLPETPRKRRTKHELQNEKIEPRK